MVTSIKSFWEMTCNWAIRVFSTHFISFVWNLNQIFQVSVCVASLLYILVYSFHLEGRFGPIFFYWCAQFGELLVTYSCVRGIDFVLLFSRFFHWSLALFRHCSIVLLFHVVIDPMFQFIGHYWKQEKSIGCVVCILEVMETNYSLLGYYIFIDQST